jgi:hypothetical protein
MRSVMVLVIALVAPGCKGMGALGHVLGHVGRIAAVSSRALAPMARVAGHVAAASIRAAAHAAPLAGDVANAALNTAVAVSQVEVVEPAEEVPTYQPDSAGGPLLDDGDACGYCPEDLACGACGDVNHVACVAAPARAYTRCESSFKLHPPGW